VLLALSYRAVGRKTVWCAVILAVAAAASVYAQAGNSWLGGTNASAAAFVSVAVIAAATIRGEIHTRSASTKAHNW